MPVNLTLLAFVPAVMKNVVMLQSLPKLSECCLNNQNRLCKMLYKTEVGQKLSSVFQAEQGELFKPQKWLNL